MKNGMWVNKHKAQTGAAMVEMALVLSLFMLITFGIIEFALAYFTWHRASEGAREGLRYAMVSTPATGGNLGLSCPGGAVTVTCDVATCASILSRINRLAPFVRGDQVSITYACSSAGNPERPAEIAIPEISIELTGLSYTFAVPGILGLGTTMQLPDVRASRTGEDLFTPDGE